MLFFALKGSDTLGRSTADALGVQLAAHEERDFEDGEHKVRPLISVRGQDIYILHSLAGEPGASVNDKLVKLLLFIATCRDNGAARVTAVVPYIAYARKDRQTKARDPVTMRYIAQLFEAVAVDRVVAMEVHNFAAFQNAFRCPTIHLDARKLFCPEIRKLAKDKPATIFSPDGGGMKRAQLLRQAYEAEEGEEAGFGFMEKRRSRDVVSGELFAGDVEGRVVFLVDDIIATGGTILRAARACRERGAAAVHAVATHGLFGAGSEEIFRDGAIGRIVVTDSLTPTHRAAEQRPAKLEIVSCGPLVAATIKRLNANESISDLTGMED